LCGLPYVAKREQIAKIVARASRKYALIFTLLAETGLRPVEAEGLTLRNFDLETGVLTVKSAKNGNPRSFRLKSATLAMLNAYVQKKRFRLNDKLFPNASAMRHSFARYRGIVADNLHDPALLKIRLYDLRHYYATMLYYRTKDILHVKEQLGHKRLENTLVYTHLVNFGNEEFVCKTAKNVQEATVLIEEGFCYVCEMDGVKLFKKRK
jgi:integrase